MGKHSFFTQLVLYIHTNKASHGFGKLIVDLVPCMYSVTAYMESKVIMPFLMFIYIRKIRYAFKVLGCSCAYMQIIMDYSIVHYAECTNTYLMSMYIQC